jgi:glycosyltransferase involved in cell wall biosynthesis
MKPTVSVIVAAYNASRTIGETIESVLAQTFSDLELIIVDDGSTDETKNIVSEYQRKDERIIYVWQKNARTSAARNKGLEISKGKYISIIDADDLWEENKLSKQISTIDSAEDMIVLTGIRRFQVIDGERVWNEVTMPPCTDNGRYGVSGILLLNSFQMVFMNTALMGKELLERLGGWNVNLWTAEDWELWLRATRRSQFKIIEEPLVYYRKHSESISRSQDTLLVLDAHENLIREQVKYGGVTEKELRKALIDRQVEMCGFFIYQGNLSIAVRVLSRSLRMKQGWEHREVWMRGTEILRSAFLKMMSGR